MGVKPLNLFSRGCKFFLQGLPLWDHMFEETSMKVPKDGSIPGKIHRIFEAMFPFLGAAYP